MTGSSEAPEGERTSAAEAPAAPPERPRSGQAVELALVAAGLGLVVYLLSFVDDVGPTSSPIVPLLLGGGLLAGSLVVPTVGVRVLAPAAVLTVTGALLLLHAVVSGRDSAVVVGALVLALLEAGAAVGAVLLHAGVLRGRRPRPKTEPEPAAGPPPPGGGDVLLTHPAFPGQQYPGQPYPGSYAGHPGEPGDRYAGEHAYAQHARYGTPYGVPGYPPPPPYGMPGYDPSAPGGGADRPPNVAAGSGYHAVPVAASAETSGPGAVAGGTPAAGPTGPGMTDTGVSVVQGSGRWRSTRSYTESSGPGTSGTDASGFVAGPPTGSHAATSTGSHAAVPAASPTSTGSHAARPTTPAGSPAHAASPTSTGGYAAYPAALLFGGPVPGPTAGSVAPPSSTGSHAAPSDSADGGRDEDDRTRTIPKVTDER